MLFENSTIDPTHLPTLASVPFQKLEQSYLKVSLASTILFFLVIVVFITAMLTITKTWNKNYIPHAAYGLWLILFVINIVVTIRGFKRKAYAIRERDIIYKSGLLWQHTIAIPFNRVQHCDVAQGPIDRSFGLSSLNVYTAGGNGSDLTIPGLLPDTAQRLKTFVIKKTAIDEEE